MAFGEIVHAGHCWLSRVDNIVVHLASSGSQSQGMIWFILPAHGASYTINRYAPKRY